MAYELSQVAGWLRNTKNYVRPTPRERHHAKNNGEKRGKMIGEEIRKEQKKRAAVISLRHMSAPPAQQRPPWLDE